MSVLLYSKVARNGLSRYSATLIAATILFSTAILDRGPACAEEKPLPASKLFPDETQALFSLPNSEEFLKGWSETQIGKLAEDKQLTDFWTTQRKEIQERFGEAGWQLNLEIEDLKDITGGQISLGWISRASDESKPFSIAMVIDVVKRSVPAESFMKRIDLELKARNAVAKPVLVAGTKAMQYTLPKLPGDVRAHESFYCISKDQLFATDDLVTLTELLTAQAGTKSNSLADSELYKRVQSKIPNEENEPEMAYFVRPIGFAKLLRSIGGKTNKNQSDILLILDREGFSDLECAAGNVQIAADPFDFFHNGYLISKQPPKESVQILDFPNLDKLVAPDWISKETASVLSFSWNIKEAFPKFRGIVDALVSPGAFDGMIEGMRDDLQGPQIDIVKEVLPFLSTEFHVVTEIIKPVSPDSKRSMVILKLNDPNEKMPKILDRYGKGEPDSKPIDFEGSRIWSFENNQEAEIELDFDVNKGNKGKANQDDEPLLDKWAITIFEKFFIFASDVEMIKDVISGAKIAANKNAFDREKDVAQVTEMLGNVAGSDGRSMNQVTRSDRSFEMQYELFRQGILPESRSMMATILDKILKPKNGRQPQPQKVNGAKLPPFAAIQHFFTASGGVVRTEQDGWSVQSFILSK